MRVRVVVNFYTCEQCTDLVVLVTWLSGRRHMRIDRSQLPDAVFIESLCVLSTLLGILICLKGILFNYKLFNLTIVQFTIYQIKSICASDL